MLLSEKVDSNVRFRDIAVTTLTFAMGAKVDTKIPKKIDLPTLTEIDLARVALENSCKFIIIALTRV